MNIKGYGWGYSLSYSLQMKSDPILGGRIATYTINFLFNRFITDKNDDKNNFFLYKLDY